MKSRMLRQAIRHHSGTAMQITAIPPMMIANSLVRGVIARTVVEPTTVAGGSRRAV